MCTSTEQVIGVGVHSMQGRAQGRVGPAEVGCCLCTSTEQVVVVGVHSMRVSMALAGLQGPEAGGDQLW
jgi:hypothetical protein